jgi:hypothetical protein
LVQIGGVEQPTTLKTISSDDGSDDDRDGILLDGNGDIVRAR